MATVSDRKLADRGLVSSTVDFYLADVQSYSEYYPYGMIARSGNDGTSYRYGMNGMEKDDELKGSGNSYTTSFRLIDSRIGRWLSTDPVFHASDSPYNAFDNNPILYADPSGADGFIPTSSTDPISPEPQNLYPYEDVLRKIESIAEMGVIVASYDARIEDFTEIIEDAKLDIAAAKIQNTAAQSSKNPIVKGYSRYVNEPLIYALEVKVQELEMQRDGLIVTRNRLARDYNEALFGIMGSLGMAGGIDIGAGTGVLPKSTSQGAQLIFDLNNGLLEYKFDLGYSGESMGYSFTTIEDLPRPAIGPVVPSPIKDGNKKVSGGNTVSKKQSYLPVLYKKNSAEVIQETGVVRNVETHTIKSLPAPAVLKALPAPSKNPWINFLKNTRGTYKGTNWLQDATRDYWYLKSNGLL